MADETCLVIHAAISSRFLLLVFQFAANEFIDDYDTSSFTGFIEKTNLTTTWYDWIFQRVFGGFGKWDAEYFLKISEEGYNSCAVLTYCCSHKNLEVVTTLGLLQRKCELNESMTRRSIHQTRYQKEDGEFYNSPSVFVFVVHLAFMTLFGFTSMHVQVITRLIFSASPLIYWYTAYVIISDSTEPPYRHFRSKWKSQLILGYFLLYFFIGTALHCNFYPWT
ncbi:hypothetical protein ABFA07_011745 [Porites harrisoni]